MMLGLLSLVQSPTSNESLVRLRLDEGWTLGIFQIDNPDNTLEASEVTVNSCHPKLSLSMKNEGSRFPYIDGSGTDESLSKSFFLLT